MQTLRFHIAVEPAERSAVFSRLHWVRSCATGTVRPRARPTGYIAVCAPKALAANPIRLIDTGIAAQTIALAAASRGLGCCMLRSFDPDLNDVMGVSAVDYVTELVLAWESAASAWRWRRARPSTGLRTGAMTRASTTPKLALEDLLI